MEVGCGSTYFSCEGGPYDLSLPNSTPCELVAQPPFPLHMQANQTIFVVPDMSYNGTLRVSLLFLKGNRTGTAHRCLMVDLRPCSITRIMPPSLLLTDLQTAQSSRPQIVTVEPGGLTATHTDKLRILVVRRHGRLGFVVPFAGGPCMESAGMHTRSMPLGSCPVPDSQKEWKA